MKKKRLFIALILFLGLASFMFYQEGSLPVDKNNKGTEMFVIQKGDGLNAIVKNLSKQELIRNKIVFYLIVKKMGIEKKIQAGDFKLSKSMSAQEIASNLTHGTVDIWITVIEGLRKEEVAQILQENLSIPEIPFIERAKEGYLFPDTYLMPKTASIDTVLEVFQKNFDSKYTDALKQKIKKLGLTEKQGIILASLVEKEGKFAKDKRTVAGILLKRHKEEWPLQIDATIQYALGYQRKEKTWWKKQTTFEDLKVDSTYNTYTYKGLPPAPICSPGLESLEAVADAEANTPYWYYVSDKKGVMHFAVTLEEHNANIEKYLQ